MFLQFMFRYAFFALTPFVSLGSAKVSPAIQYLNQSTEDAEAFVHSDQFLKQNLLGLYQTEMSQLKKRWNAEANATSRHLEKAALRRARNEFYAKAVDRANAESFTALDQKLTSTRLPEDLMATAADVLDTVRNHPLGSSSSAYRIDPTGSIGFCFGRAMLTHFELLRKGVPQRVLGKIFSLGDLFVDHQHWNFHVAVIIHDQKHGTLVVDPIHEKPLPLHDWVTINKNYSIKKPLSRVRFYISDPRKFLPQEGFYSEAEMGHKEYKDYFVRLLGDMNTAMRASPR